ncbi:hypothetical protein HMPREF1868_00053 [Olsenella sp. DNF00959]|nr:hypothetical protein HMPREF1868_00053 [Olsenella sp. DNF00959]
MTGMTARVRGRVVGGRLARVLLDDVQRVREGADGVQRVFLLPANWANAEARGVLDVFERIWHASGVFIKERCALDEMAQPSPWRPQSIVHPVPVPAAGTSAQDEKSDIQTINLSNRHCDS